MATALASSHRESSIKTYRSMAEVQSQSNDGKMTESQQKTPKMAQKENEHMDEFPNYINTFDHILKNYGILNIGEQLYNRLFSLYMIEPINSKTLEASEVILGNFYKCDFFHQNCFFTTNSMDRFKYHLNANHAEQSLYCHYCIKGHKDCSNAVQQSDADQLIEHMHSEHKHLKYQCNLCYYRSVERHQVFLHQAFEHSKEFDETIRKVLMDKKDEENLNSFEEQYLISLNEEHNLNDETESEDDSSNQAIINAKYAKVLYDPKIKTFSPLVNMRYLNSHGFNIDLIHVKSTINNDFFFHCAYCSKVTKSVDDLLVHLITEHYQHPILSIDLMAYCQKYIIDDNFMAVLRQKIKRQNASNNKIILKLNEDDEHCDNLVSNLIAFKQRHASYNIPTSYDKSFIEKACAENLSDSYAMPKGVKRKNANDKEEEEEKDGSDIVKFGHHFKRQRPAFIPEVIWNRGRSITRVMATAAAAFGFYHLTNIFTFTVQNYLNQN